MHQCCLDGLEDVAAAPDMEAHPCHGEKLLVEHCSTWGEGWRMLFPLVLTLRGLLAPNFAGTWEQRVPKGAVPTVTARTHTGVFPIPKKKHSPQNVIRKYLQPAEHRHRLHQPHICGELSSHQDRQRKLSLMCWQLCLSRVTHSGGLSEQPQHTAARRLFKKPRKSPRPSLDLHWAITPPCAVGLHYQASISAASIV